MANEAAAPAISVWKVVVVGYALASLFAFLVGWPLLHSVTALVDLPAYFVIYAALGPLALVADAHTGGGSIFDRMINIPIVITYMLATLLLGTGLAVATRRHRVVRAIGYSLMAAVWLGSGLLIAFGPLYE